VAVDSPRIRPEALVRTARVVSRVRIVASRLSTSVADSVNPGFSSRRILDVAE
jgi:hypothetical protein